MESRTRKVFVLGTPGSGKSTAIQWIKQYVEECHKGWQSHHLNDYPILRLMFKDDKDQQRFDPTVHNEFVVRDPGVYDEALRILKRGVESVIKQPALKRQLLLIEFARSNYQQAFDVFGSNFLQDAYFLFLDADIETCISRTHLRMLCPETENDYFIDERVFETYRDEVNRRYFRVEFEKEYFGTDRRLRIIENNNSLQEVLDQAYNYIDRILGQEEPDIEETAQEAGEEVAGRV